MSGTAFLKARDFLLAHRDDYETAYREFRWPVLDRFNWALDYFDPMAAGNNRPGLWIVDEGGGRNPAQFCRTGRAVEPARQSFALARRTPRRSLADDARQCRAVVGMHAGGDETRRGRHPGDDAADARRSSRPLCPRPGPPCRRRRRQCRQIRRSARRLHADCGRRGVPGLAVWEAGYDAPAEFVPDGETRATDPLLLYFTSGTTAKPKLVLHSHQSYPVGHLSTMYWLGVKPGDVHLNISSPGWAKHAYSCVFAPWNAGATVFMLNQPPLQRTEACSTRSRAAV